ncbi:RNA dependent RNA polymerase-domain-containing protein [Mycena galopus ATCC 62051]|nr:RNA dependent RNA polymerase-domain-containing protein [Mycena galopus ATCC 62051]
MSQAASDGSFEGVDDYANFDWDLNELDKVISPTKPQQWRSSAVVDCSWSDGSPATPATPSRPPRSNSGRGSATAISRTLAQVEIEDDELPLLFFDSRQFEERQGADSWKADDEEREVDDEREADDVLVQDRSRSPSVFSPMAPPAIPRPRPPPLQASSTQTSIETASSSNSLFSAISRTSSTSSIGSMDLPGRTSPLKRGAETQHVSPSSSSKSRKLSETQNANETPVPGRLQTSGLSRKTRTSSSNPFSLSELFGGHHGSALEKHVIVHSKEVQKLFDSRGVALGVQWELARGVSTGKWTWEEIETRMMKDFDVLIGPNSKIAWKVPGIMRGREMADSESHGLALWNEVDREHEATREGESRGLGLVDGPWEHWDGPSSYYGGQIEYPLRLSKSDDPEQRYKIVLEKPRKGRGEDVRKFLAQRFIINGRVYVPIPPKDTTSVYLIQTDENHERTTLPWYGDDRRFSFDEFVKRHNPPGLNSKQPFAKYTARYALGLSTSIPVLEFDSENIFYIPDIIANDWVGDATTKPPSEKIMTDGCGWINRSALLLITNRIGYPSLPTAVQGRIGGAKGLWTLHPTDEDQKPKIWIRDSQLKIKLSGNLRVHRIFDLLRASRPSQTDARQRLSQQSILCLSFNGIPDEVLVSLLVEGLEATVKPLLDWAPGAASSLWRAIDQAGNVSGTRLQRIAASKSRTLGFRDREPNEQDAQPEPADDSASTTSGFSGRDKSGGPLSLHERALELIQAGFHPKTSAYLNDKIRYIVKNEINAVVNEFRISLPESTASRLSSFQTLKGPVIVTAVDIPELHNWPDVIITSTVGQHSLLSLLGGGDYDGDTVVFIWLEEFCKNFGLNQPLTPAPESLMSKFEQEVKTVEQVGRELEGLSPEDSQRTFQEYLLKGLRDSKVGLYSYFHDYAIWRYGYGHANAILMAYIGNTLLDASKTGLCLKDEIFEEHQREFNHRPKSNNWRGPRYTLHPFILQTLFRMKAKSEAPAEWSALYKSELEEIERHTYSIAKETEEKAKRIADAKRAAFVLAAQEKFAEPIPNVQFISAEEVERVKASYAYSLGSSDDFGFVIAFGTLCAIKARAAPGGMAPNCRLFDELKTISGPAARATLDEDDDDV